MTDRNQSSIPPTSLLPEDAKCFRCGYRLCGLPNRICPECGLTFDPQDLSSYHTPVWPDRLRRYGRPPLKKHTWILVAVVLLVFIDVSRPGPSKFIPPIISPVGIALLAWLSIDWILRLIVRRIAKQMPDTPPPNPTRSWLCLPVLLVILLSFKIYPWPAYLRFQLSRSAFEHAVQDMPLIADPAGEYIGWHRVFDIRENPDGCIFFDLGGGYLRKSGFWFIPTDAPMVSGKSYTRHELIENWYIGGQRL